MPARRLSALAVAVPVLLMASVAISGLERWPLWDAESWTRNVALGSLSDLLAAVRDDRHPPLYFLLAKGSATLGDRDGWLRLPSALGAIGTVAALAAATLRRGPGAAWVAGLLLATSPYLAAYAGTARSGAVLALAGAVSWWLTLRVLDGHQRSAIGLGIALLLGMYVHYGMACVLVASGVTVLAAPGPSRRWGLAAVVLAGLGVLPWLLGPGATQLESAGQREATWAAYRYLLWPVGPSWTLDGAWLLAALAGLGALLALRERWPMVLGWLVGATLVPAVLSTGARVHAKAYVFACLLPGFAWFLGQLARGAWWRTVATTALVLALQVPGLLHILALPANQASLSPRSRGVHDTRRDVAVLLQVGEATGATVPRGNRNWQDWVRYAPGLKRFESRWKLVARRPSERKRTRDCTMAYGFIAEFQVPSPRECKVLLAALAQHADGYGPYELELAVAARSAGRADAVDLARTAASHTPGAGMAEGVLATWLVEDGQPDDALTVLAQGIAKAEAHGRTAEWIQLEQQRLALLRGPERDAAASRVQCMQDAINTWGARACD